MYSYAGMRDVRVEGRRILLNGEPLYQRQVLDQGYWPEGIYTPPTDQALMADVEWIKRLGFNGVRKHQKVECPRWLYWCDRLGVLVWDEMPAFLDDTQASRERFKREWQEVIKRDSSHPCVITWAPFNESFGIRDLSANRSAQAFVAGVVDDTRRLDPSRLVVDNSGLGTRGHGHRGYTQLRAERSSLQGRVESLSGRPGGGQHASVVGRDLPGARMVRFTVRAPAVRAGQDV